jgi:hypothetical protein
MDECWPSWQFIRKTDIGARRLILAIAKSTGECKTVGATTSRAAPASDASSLQGDRDARARLPAKPVSGIHDVAIAPFSTSMRL